MTISPYYSSRIQTYMTTKIYTSSKFKLRVQNSKLRICIEPDQIQCVCMCVLIQSFAFCSPSTTLAM